MTEKARRLGRASQHKRAPCPTARTPGAERYRLVGHKWFMSAPMSDAFPGRRRRLRPGPDVLSSCRAGLPDGTLNAVRIPAPEATSWATRPTRAPKWSSSTRFAWRVGDEGPWPAADSSRWGAPDAPRLRRSARAGLMARRAVAGPAPRDPPHGLRQGAWSNTRLNAQRAGPTWRWRARASTAPGAAPGAAPGPSAAESADTPGRRARARGGDAPPADARGQVLGLQARQPLRAGGDGVPGAAKWLRRRGRGEGRDGAHLPRDAAQLESGEGRPANIMALDLLAAALRSRGRSPTPCSTRLAPPKGAHPACSIARSRACLVRVENGVDEIDRAPLRTRLGAGRAGHVAGADRAGRPCFAAFCESRLDGAPDGLRTTGVAATDFRHHPEGAPAPH